MTSGIAMARMDKVVKRQVCIIVAYVTPYIDERLYDMGLPARCCHNLLSKNLKPVWAERYKGLAEAHQRIREAAHDDAHRGRT
jgi:hypothetical protein